MEGKEKKKRIGVDGLCVVEDKTNKDESGGVRLIEVYKVSRVFLGIETLLCESARNNSHLFLEFYAEAYLDRV